MEKRKKKEETAGMTHINGEKKMKKTISYKKHKAGYVYFEGSTDLHRFYRSMAPTVDELKDVLQREFPGYSLELELSTQALAS